MSRPPSTPGRSSPEQDKQPQASAAAAPTPRASSPPPPIIRFEGSPSPVLQQPESADRCPRTASPVGLAAANPVEAGGDVFPQAVLIQDQDGDPIAVDLHPAVGDLSLEDPPEVVVPEDPVSFSQVLTYVEVQATPEEKDRLRRLLGSPSPTVVPTRNRRVQADLRPLHREQSSQAQLRPRVTRLPGGGVSVEGVDFTFRHHGVVEEQDFNM